MQTVLIAGGSGLVGQRLAEMLKTKGYKVLILTRQHDLARDTEDYVHWDIEKKIMDPKALEADHVVNLSGAGIADEKWSSDRKRLLIQSRTETTRFLISKLSEKKELLQSFVSASAVGFYGNTGDQYVDESSAPVKNDFLSDVCRLWEESAKIAIPITHSFTILRIGVVLSEKGGALDKMAKTIPFGMANYLGSGKQYMSWIHIDDLCDMILHCMIKPQNESLYNAVAPEVVTNKNFTDQLRQVINPRALLMPAPALAIKLLFGEMSKVVLNSSRVRSDKIRQDGFQFKYPLLSEALSDIYGKN